MNWKTALLPFATIGFAGAACAQAEGPDPDNSAHCEVALQIAVTIARNFEPAKAAEFERHAKLAAEQTAARLSPAEAAAARKQVWPFLTNKATVAHLVEACHARQEQETSPAAAETPFEDAASRYAECMKAMTQLGMRLKLQPAEFRDGLKLRCRAEEARFRAAGIAEAMRQGRSRAEAVAEIDGNIRNAHEAFAADQASYVRSGKVPR